MPYEKLTHPLRMHFMPFDAQFMPSGLPAPRPLATLAAYQKKEWL
jgi:hypothetical protein